MQTTLAVHIECDERLAAYLDDKLFAEALSELRKPFPENTAAELEATLQELAPKTSKYLEGRIKVAPYSYASAQPLEPHSQKSKLPASILPTLYSRLRNGKISSRISWQRWRRCLPVKRCYLHDYPVIRISRHLRNRNRRRLIICNGKNRFMGEQSAFPPRI
jgi:hypothetical protein